MIHKIPQKRYKFNSKFSFGPFDINKIYSNLYTKRGFDKVSKNLARHRFKN